MKPKFHRVPTPNLSSFNIRHDVVTNFGTDWHYHPELELHYVIKGEGVRLIGDNISNFSPGELILMGENLPHMWQSNEDFYKDNPNGNVEAFVLHFLPDCLSKDFLDLPEVHLLPTLFERAKKGMQIFGYSKKRIIGLLKAAQDTSDLGKIVLLLSILKVLAETDQYKYIANPHAFYKIGNDADTGRINEIYTYTLSHFKEDISLADISKIAALSVTSFCRYFKEITKKTYYDFLIEVRISHACRMLVEDKIPVGMICYETGFNNISNFYRHFKKVTKMTPSFYKKKYINNNRPQSEKS